MVGALDPLGAVLPSYDLWGAVVLVMFFSAPPAVPVAIASWNFFWMDTLVSSAFDCERNMMVVTLVWMTFIVMGVAVPVD